MGRGMYSIPILEMGFILSADSLLTVFRLQGSDGPICLFLRILIDFKLSRRFVISDFRLLYWMVAPFAITLYSCIYD
jgi:hypothetical protein